MLQFPIWISVYYLYCFPFISQPSCLLSLRRLSTKLKHTLDKTKIRVSTCQARTTFYFAGWIQRMPTSIDAGRPGSVRLVRDDGDIAPDLLHKKGTIFVQLLFRFRRERLGARGARVEPQTGSPIPQGEPNFQVISYQLHSFMNNKAFKANSR